ncbi:hypothetical protein NDN08_002874 [Rhodosorus marinus]|uniref:Uncharacterized protein n=1 Tax=Rhodosorus marinus TaxID=101924 RepID=A0AAV8UUY1_9RHOD|nr:hypothetical protein NDN08_002874 [Rhodosorus marinus]
MRYKSSFEEFPDTSKRTRGRGRGRGRRSHEVEDQNPGREATDTKDRESDSLWDNASRYVESNEEEVHEGYDIERILQGTKDVVLDNIDSGEYRFDFVLDLELVNDALASVPQYCVLHLTPEESGLEAQSHLELKEKLLSSYEAAQRAVAPVCKTQNEPMASAAEQRTTSAAETDDKDADDGFDEWLEAV